MIVPLGFALVMLLVAAGLVTGGVVLLRSASRGTRSRIPVEAVVVHRTRHRRPASVTFDHPVPGGWSRVTRVEALPVTRPGGGIAHPGDHITVWAHPQNPWDVRLGGGSAPSSAFGVMLVAAGSGAAALALWFATTVLAFVR